MPSLKTTDTATSTSVLFIESSTLLRNTIREKLQKFQHIQRLESVKSIEEGVSYLQHLDTGNKKHPLIILINLNLWTLLARTRLQRITTQSPDIHVLLFSQETPPDVTIIDALSSGIHGYYQSTFSDVTFTQAIETVGKGGIWLDPKVTHLGLCLFKMLLISKLKATNVPSSST